MRAIWEALWADLDYPAPTGGALICWAAAVFVCAVLGVVTVDAWLA